MGHGNPSRGRSAPAGEAATAAVFQLQLKKGFYGGVKGATILSNLRFLRGRL
jgi:hypothetical protein